LLKGRTNYLCLHRLELAEQQAYARGLRRDIATALPVIREWATVTRRGEIAELAQVGEADPVWAWVTSTRENCLGPECPAFDRCHVVAARRRAQEADVVIVNHHLLLADLVLKEEGFGNLLPGADAIVVDEAHQLSEVASMFLGFTLSTRQLNALSRDLAGELIANTTTQVAASFAQTFDRQVADLQDQFGTADVRREAAAWSAGVIESLERVQGSLSQLVAALTDSAKVSAGLAAVRRRAAELSLRIGTLLTNDAESNLAGVRWAQSAPHGMSFHYVPVDVATQLGALIDASAGTWICTSATLAVSGDFSHFARRVGMEASKTALYGSPFDYVRQALLYLPRGLDAPASSRYARQVVDAALPVLHASGGRAFLLFTSHRALREAATCLRELLGPAAAFPILVQGEAPREVLLARFREEGNAVLLGTSSFWEGVDVKGPALSVVVIDKLPFAVPDDPVLKARLSAIERRGGNPFFEEQIPQAVIELKQGVGRLIRDPDDFGVIMLCDPRLRTRGYGRIFLDSLPPMPRTQALEDVTNFLRSKLRAAGIDIQSAVDAAQLPGIDGG
jgi:ATP-dependent DNA helicase DinG